MRGSIEVWLVPNSSCAHKHVNVQRIADTESASHRRLKPTQIV